jgi:hypothetical protein
MTPEILPHLANAQSRIGARLLWTPPLVTSSMALIGLAIMLCSFAGLLTAWFGRRRQIAFAPIITGDEPSAESPKKPQPGSILAVLQHVAVPLDTRGQHTTKFAPAPSRHVMAHYLAFRFAKQVSEGVVDPVLIDQVRHRISISGSTFGIELLSALQTQLPSMPVDALIAHITTYDALLGGQLRDLHTQIGTVSSPSSEPAKVSEGISLSVA